MKKSAVITIAALLAGVDLDVGPRQRTAPLAGVNAQLAVGLDHLQSQLVGVVGP